MNICKQCGVELDDQMQVCPLCDTSLLSGDKGKEDVRHVRIPNDKVKPAMLAHVLWQITCVLLLSGIIATVTINLSIVGRITWSIYPVTICLIILSYASFMAFWREKVLIPVSIGWIVSTLLLIAVNAYSEEDWPVRLAIPILCAVNVLCILLVLILKYLKVKGLNILAIMFVAIAVLCLAIEGIISLYFKNIIELRWSVIVAACLLPVTAAIVFMFFRTRSNSDLQKIFHT